MCKLCEYNTGKISSLEGIKILHCSWCPYIIAIPKIEGLEELYCCACPLLKTIPKIEGLKILNCSWSQCVTSIPKISTLKWIRCSNCPWLPNKDNKDYNSNIGRLIKTQKIVKNFLLRRRLKSITPEILKVYYHPEMKGGYFHKKNMLEWLTAIKE